MEGYQVSNATSVEKTHRGEIRSEQLSRPWKWSMRLHTTDSWWVRREMSNTSKQTRIIREDNKSICRDKENERQLGWDFCGHSSLCVGSIFDVWPLRTCCCSLTSRPAPFNLSVPEKKNITLWIHLQVHTFVMWLFWQWMHTNQLYDY